MSEQTRRYVFGFWRLADDILNAILFLLVGVEVVAIGFNSSYLPLGIAAFAIAAGARFVAVSGAVGLLKGWCEFPPMTSAIMTWAGIRGGVSVALALSIPFSDARGLIVAITYWLALFSILLQALTFQWAMGKLLGSRSRAC